MKLKAESRAYQSFSRCEIVSKTLVFDAGKISPCFGLIIAHELSSIWLSSSVRSGILSFALGKTPKYPAKKANWLKNERF